MMVVSRYSAASVFFRVGFLKREPMLIFKLDRTFYTKKLVYSFQKERFLQFTRDSAIYTVFYSRVNLDHFSRQIFSSGERGVLLAYLTVSTLPVFVLTFKLV